MSTMEQQLDIDPEPADEPPTRRRRPATHADDWKRGQDQYEAALDRMGPQT